MKKIIENIKSEREFTRIIKDAFSGKIKAKKNAIKVFKHGDTEVSVF